MEVNVRSAERCFSRCLVLPLKQQPRDVDRWSSVQEHLAHLHDTGALDSIPGTKIIITKTINAIDSLLTFWKSVYTINSLRRRMGHLLLELGTQFSWALEQKLFSSWIRVCQFGNRLLSRPDALLSCRVLSLNSVQCILLGCILLFPQNWGDLTRGGQWCRHSTHGVCIEGLMENALTEQSVFSW